MEAVQVAERVRIRNPIFESQEDGLTFILDHFPMPPSENHLYPTGAHGRRFKNTKGWDKAVAQWAQTREDLLKRIRSSLRDKLEDQRHVVRVDTACVLGPQEIWRAKTGLMAPWDPSNRIKALHDAMTTLLYVNDTYFFPGPTQKVWGDNGEHGFAILTLRVLRLPTLTSYLEDLRFEIGVRNQ